MQDVQSGRGGCFFDFHGEDARWLIDHIPKDRIEDVVYFNPLDPNVAVGFNTLAGIAPQHYATYTDDIVEALRHIFASSWGPRMDDILYRRKAKAHSSARCVCSSTHTTAGLR